MPNLIFIPRKQAAGFEFIGATAATFPPQWVSGPGTATGDTIVIDDIPLAKNGDLVLTGQICQIQMLVTSTPPNWTIETTGTEVRVWRRNINSDTGSHTWIYDTLGISRAGVQATFRKAVLSTDINWSDSFTVPDLINPVAGSALVVMTQTMFDPLIPAGALFLEQTHKTRGNSSYQVAIVCSLLIEQNLPAGNISGRIAHTGPEAAHGFRGWVGIVSPTI